jgi:TPR repeat protein
MRRIFILLILSFTLAACATTTSPRTASELAQGKRLYEQGYYKRAMQDLLPLACDGNAEAQYVVGYMYYYGNGVTQDTDVGVFWIKRSARQGYAPAVQALEMIEKK